MNRLHRRLVIGLSALTVLTVVVARPGHAAVEPRAILKTYFETGDVPTQEQFKDVIDSALNLVDDGLTSYSVRDASGRAPRLDEGTSVGPGLPFAPLVDVAGFSPDWRGHSGFLPLAYLQGPDLHYAYLQIASPVPGAPNPNSMFVEYLVFETDSNTALTTQSVPEPASILLALMAIGGLLAWRRQPRQD
jgi:hypothetical protein